MLLRQSKQPLNRYLRFSDISLLCTTFPFASFADRVASAIQSGYLFFRGGGSRLFFHEIWLSQLYTPYIQWIKSSDCFVRIVVHDVISRLLSTNRLLKSTAFFAVLCLTQIIPDVNHHDLPQ